MTTLSIHKKEVFLIVTAVILSAALALAAPLPPEVPFKLAQGFGIVVRGGIGPFNNLNFLVDTGAVPSVLSKRIASRIGVSGVCGPFALVHKDGKAQYVTVDESGVLISDFYAAYDSIHCAQQKCLIHLMRDINDDLSEQPFNEEMRELAQDFANVLKLIVDSVDRFGLKAYHLRKHKDSVNRFYEALSRRDYQAEVAAGYKKRLERNSDKLFTFLDHDGVPWNKQR